MKAVGAQFGRLKTIFVLIFCLAATLLSARANRVDIDLGGQWQFQNVTALSYPPPATNWQSVTVPGFLNGWQYDHAWFRQTFNVPKTMAGTRLKLEFGGVKFNALVWLNGVYIGQHLNGYNPFEFDVSSAATPGQTNELIIGVTDWTATFISPVDFSGLPSGADPRGYVTNDIVAPIGGYYQLYGVWQPVILRSVPAVSLADVFIKPSVQSATLGVQLSLRNDGTQPASITISNVVADASGSPVVSFIPSTFEISPGLTNVILSVPWTNAHLWAPEDPYLHTLATTVAAGTNIDSVTTRFGFREFRTSGGRFYLNGTPINLHATAAWPTTDLANTNQIRQALTQVKGANCNAMRFHTQPWDEPWYQIADEIGLLVVEEAAVWCDPFAYKLSSGSFWTNYSDHVSAAVRRDRNHPSIVLWSLENEILHCGGDQAYSGTAAELAALGAMVKLEDPTRPITYEADLDPQGEADVLGLHYPHEFPDYQVWPNTAYWMNQPIARSWMPGGEWIWDHSKPLYIGEFLYVPPTAASGFTIFFGDDAFLNPTYYRNQSKGLAWKMQIEAYRAYGVNGIAPYTMFEDPASNWSSFDLNPSSNYLYQVQKNVFEPNAVVVSEYNTRFFAGSNVLRHVHVYNDKPTAGLFELRWNISGGGAQSTSFTLDPAQSWDGTVTFSAPTTAGPFSLNLELDEGVTVAFTNTLNYTASPAATLSAPSGKRIGLFDPGGQMGALFDHFGVAYQSVTNLQAAGLSTLDLLVVGPGALAGLPAAQIGTNSVAPQWLDFAQHGGWVLVLDQTNYPAWMPGTLTLQKYDASFAFPANDHPIMAGLTPEDLRWWAGDNRVVYQALTAPSRGNVRNLASIGSTTGLEYSAALELPVGTGGILCEQWPLVEEFATEPTANDLLQRLLNYALGSGGHVSLKPTALLAEPGSSLALKLATLGLQSENFSGRIGACDPSLYPLLIIGGGSNAWNEAWSNLGSLTNFVARGGRILLHRPSAGFVDAAGSELFPHLQSIDEPNGLVLRRDDTNLLVHVSNHNLYWIDQPATWNTQETISSNIASRVYRRKFDLTNYQNITVKNMPYHSTGNASGPGWWLYKNGSVAQTIVAPAAGLYLFEIEAAGTPALGGWPHIALQIDGITQDHAFVTSETNAFYTLAADISQGQHQLAISYDNDLYAPPEDRNVYLVSILWGRSTDGEAADLSTSPGVLAQDGSIHASVILDEVTWETESVNQTKAERYASSLLTSLGARLLQSTALNLPPGGMSNVNIAAFSTDNGVAYVNSDGRIQTNVTFTSTGDYSFVITAGGTPAAGVLPKIGLIIDGVARTNFLLLTTNLTSYTVTFPLSAGNHSIGLAFENDYYAAPEDRNAVFAGLLVSVIASPQITALVPDVADETATLQWQGTLGAVYSIESSPSLSSPDWKTLSIQTNAGTLQSWADQGGTNSSRPFSTNEPARIYRLRQMQP